MLLSENKYDDDNELILMTNRKLRMLFRLAPRSMALDDLEDLNCYISSNFLGIPRVFADFGSNNG